MKSTSFRSGTLHSWLNLYDLIHEVNDVHRKRATIYVTVFVAIGSLQLVYQTAKAKLGGHLDLDDLNYIAYLAF